MEEISKINKKINETAPQGGFREGGGPGSTSLDAAPSGPLTDAAGVFQPREGGGFKWTRTQ